MLLPAQLTELSAAMRDTGERLERERSMDRDGYLIACELVAAAMRVAEYVESIKTGLDPAAETIKD